MYNILSLDSKEFKKYGKVLSGYDFDELLEALSKTPLTDGVEYVASVKELESCAVKKQLCSNYYGQMPIQIGYCNGVNEKNEFVEYHRSSEVNIAGDDMILVLGLESDIEVDGTYDAGKCEAFLVPKGTAVEIYATTLHYAPVSVQGRSFRVAIVLPEGTNLELDSIDIACDEDKLLNAKNKWLIPIK